MLLTRCTCTLTVVPLAQLLWRTRPELLPTLFSLHQHSVVYNSLRTLLQKMSQCYQMMALSRSPAVRMLQTLYSFMLTVARARRSGFGTKAEQLLVQLSLFRTLVAFS
eukprot:Rmarinus@m.6603